MLGNGFGDVDVAGGVVRVYFVFIVEIISPRDEEFLIDHKYLFSFGSSFWFVVCNTVDDCIFVEIEC